MPRADASTNPPRPRSEDPGVWALAARARSLRCVPAGRLGPLSSLPAFRPKPSEHMTPREDLTYLRVGLAILETLDPNEELTREELDLLAFKLGNLGREGRVKNNGGPNSTPDGGVAGQAQRDRGLGAGAILLLGLLALVVLFVLAKIALRRARFLTRDPRRVAGACRREVVDFLLDQGIEVPRSVPPRELGSLLGRRAGIEATDFAEALGLARFGPLSAASAAAREARRELRAVRRRLRRALPLGGRVRGLFSMRSLLANR